MVCFGSNSRAVQSWEVCELEFQFFQWRAYVSYGEFFKVTCAAVHELYRSNLVCTLIPILKVCFGPKSIAVQSWEVCELEFQFFQWRAYVNYGEFFKVTCAAVHELYRSNLVCTLIAILKGVFWSKQHSCTVLGSL